MKRGFTLIELLVSIAIFSLLSSFVVANYRSNERTRKLKNEAQLIMSGLEQAQNMSLTGALANNLTPVAYKFLINNCPVNCVYQINAVFANEEVPVSQTHLKAAAIKTSSGQDLMVEFNLPRGRMNLSDGAASAWLEITNGENFYCLKMTAVSGRIDLKSGQCL